MRRARRIFPGTLLAWTVAVIAASRLTALRRSEFQLYDVVGALIIALVITSAMVLLETRRPSHATSKYWPGKDLAARSIVYAILASLMVWLMWWALPRLVPGVEPLRHGRPFLEVVTDPRIQRFIIALVLSSAAINFLLHLRFVIGPIHLRALFTGKYRDPQYEDRCFVFIDLIDSTSIAQRLGPMKFTYFKHDFFSDLSGPISNSDGQIIQYVGDEVMLSWKVKLVTASGGPIVFVDQAREQLALRADNYLEHYGIVPDFRTGIHLGTIVVSQVGDIRRDIVYSGDVVNTAARLLQACRPEGVQLLMSADVFDLLPAAFRQNFTRHHPLELRGRANPLATYTRVVQVDEECAKIIVRRSILK